jgi:pimeloyl-ACP methyl ester carboxylesterase
VAAQQHSTSGTRTSAAPRSFAVAWLLAAVAASSGCATTVEQVAARAGLERVDLQGSPFRHRSWVKQAPGDTVHVFIEGDGRPWIDGEVPADDPTPRAPLTLRLMLETPGPAAYVGRPCYFGVADPKCEPRFWTHGRFAPEVVASMRVVIDALVARSGARDCVLVGHSGGGALALLVAPELASRCSIVTVAGLVDTEAWTRWQGYEPLEGSLNPAAAIERVAGIPQAHLVGLRDRNIPPEQTKQALADVPAAAILELAAFDHGCCWEREWRTLLPRIEQTLQSLRAAAPQHGGNRAAAQLEPK